MYYQEALSLANELKKKLENEYNMKCYIVGSLKRHEPKINDIDYVCSSKLFDDNNRRFIKFKYKNKDINIWRTNNINFTKMMRTFSKNDNIQLRAIAKYRKYHLNDYGLFKDDNKIHINNKKELLKVLNIHHII